MGLYEDILSGKEYRDPQGFRVTEAKDIHRLNASDQSEIREKHRYSMLHEPERYADDNGLRWVTLGQPGEDGAHVQIDGNGNIHKGPEGMAGKNVSELKGDQDMETNEDKEQSVVTPVTEPSMPSMPSLGDVSLDKLRNEVINDVVTDARNANYRQLQRWPMEYRLAEINGLAQQSKAWWNERRDLDVKMGEWVGEITKVGESARKKASKPKKQTSKRGSGASTRNRASDKQINYLTNLWWKMNDRGWRGMEGMTTAPFDTYDILDMDSKTASKWISTLRTEIG